MIFRQYVPGEPLASYVDTFWFYEDLAVPHRRERVLPDGTFQLIINLRDEPRRLFERGGAAQETLFRGAWISGAHSQYIVIDALPGSSMIGAHFKPGGAAAVLGLPAHELRNRVVELDGIWNAAASELREQLLAACRPDAKFRILEQWLLGRLHCRAADHQMRQRIVWARDRFVRADALPIGDVVAQLGISHRRFINEFQAEVGMTPKQFCRIRRFQQVIARLQAARTVKWADVACACGYFDQAHFVNDFRAFSGLRPTDYLRHAGAEHGNFVPVEERA